MTKTYLPMNKPHTATRPWIILDRDGVINEDSDTFVKNLSEFRFIPGSIEAIAALTQADIPVTVATNQSGLARGLFSHETLAQMHAHLEAAIQAVGGKLSAIAFCPHGPDDACTCRKPLPGLLYTLHTQMGLPLEDAIVIGDSLRDLEAAIAVGAKPVLVLSGKGTRTLEKHPELAQKLDIYPNLHYFVEAFLHGPSHER